MNERILTPREGYHQGHTLRVVGSGLRATAMKDGEPELIDRAEVITCSCGRVLHLDNDDVVLSNDDVLSMIESIPKEGA